MSESSPHEPHGMPGQTDNPFASPQAAVELEQWWVPDRPLRRPYPPALCQVAFLVDLVVSVALLFIGCFSLYAGMVPSSRGTASGPAALLIQAGPLAALAMWLLAAIADSLGLMSRPRAWPIGVAAFVVFWLWLLLSLVGGGTGWYGASVGGSPVAGRVLFNLLWFAALMRYRLWYARQMAIQRMPEQG